jgi:hypothetical protein
MTKHRIISPLILLTMAFGTCTAAYAGNHGSAPEIDPSLAVSAIALLGGSLAILRLRRKKS